MLLKKLLIVPCDRLAKPAGSGAWWSRVTSPVNKWLGRLPVTHDGELHYWGDVPHILGKENTFMLASPLDERLTLIPPEPNCPYPSCHGTTHARYINEKELEQAVREVDAVLLSVAAGSRVEKTLNIANKLDKPVAILDWPDHAELYGDPNRVKSTYREFIYGRDFQLYFKQDLLPEIANEYTLPISPLPIRPEAFNFKPQEKKYTLFFSGRPRYEISQGDKKEIIDEVKENIPNTKIVLHYDRSTFMTRDTYTETLAASQISLSPSCRVWDSFRHCEVGISPRTALLAPEPYISTAGPPMKDGVNAILYKTKLVEDKYHLDDASIIERIRQYLDDPDKLLEMADRWRKDVYAGHTVNARSRYILEAIGNIL